MTFNVDEQGRIAGWSLDEWNDAYGKVDNYFCALRVRNKLLRGALVSRVIERAIGDAPSHPGSTPSVLALNELESVVEEWFADVLDVPRDTNAPVLSDRGRLALLLADMPGKWQDEFLQPPPWPEKFQRAMRETFLRSHPRLQLSPMTPRPMDFGPMAAIGHLVNFPYFRAILGLFLFAAIVVVLFLVTH